MGMTNRAGSAFGMFPRVLVAALGLMALEAWAQDPRPAEPTEAAAAAEPAAQPIPVAQIPARAEDATASLRSIRGRLAPTAAVEQVRKELEEFAGQLEEIQADPALANLSQLGIRSLDDLDQRWQSASRTVRGWETVLADRARALDQQLVLLKTTREPWSLTLENAADGALPEALIDRIRGLLAEFDEVERLTRQRLDAVLTIQNRVSEWLVVIGDTMNMIDLAKTAFRDQMLIRLDGPPLWKIFAAEEGDAADKVQQQLGQSWRESLSTAGSYVATYPDRAIAASLAFLILAGGLLLARARRRARGDAATGPGDDVIDVLANPVAAAFLLAILAALWLFGGAPLAVKEILRAGAAVPVFLLLRRVVHEEMRLPVYALIALYVIDMGGALAARRPEIERLLDLLIAGSALAVLLWTLRPHGWAATYRGGTYWKIARTLLKAAVLLLTTAVVANIAGAVSLSSLLTDGVLSSAYAGLGWYAILLVVQGLMDMFLRSAVAARSRGLTSNSAAVKAQFTRLTNLLGALAWLTVTLRAFRVSEPVWDGLKTLFFTKLTFGNFDISLSDVFAFAIALWAGFAISRMLRFVLEEDVFPRVSLPRGVPSAISAMVHYALLTIAFFIALAVAGIELGKFAIIAGAVGVGIGFGLQNVVNNFVSGLILLFERPIQAGDAVELGPLFGRVVRIGIRSSTVRTYQGAEVIVPNADLISKEVINWTLSDSHRRLEVPVGVSYSSEPRQIVEILLAAANAHKEVMSEPEPFVIFVGYGASSIDFELRCWIQSFAEGLRIQTDLYLDIWDRLKAAGVEIPFPQQDLHVRSVDPAAAAALSGRPGPTPSTPLPPPPPPAGAASPRPAAKPNREDPVPSDDAGGEASEPP